MKDRSFDADFIIIGSGPAGVSAAFPLVQAGAVVRMIDGAHSEERSDSSGWQRMLGAQLEALLPEDGLSPKLRTPVARRIVHEFERAYDVRDDEFVAIGAISRGGLSRIWGGFVCEFDAIDLQGWPFSIEDLRPFYKTVTERIGVCGSADDDMANFYGGSGALLPPLPLGPSAARLRERYHSGLRRPEFALGLARNAILTVDRNGRKACNLSGDCLWGCPRGAIYDSRIDLAQLQRHRSFQIVDGALATRLVGAGNGWEVWTKDGRRFGAHKIVIAAGTLATAILIAPLLPNAISELRLLNNPVVAMPLFLPEMLGRSAPGEGYSLAQLGYRLLYGAAMNEYITGGIYQIDSLPISSFVEHLPFSRRAGVEFFMAVRSALLVATAYFPGIYSDNKIRLERKCDEMSVVIRGGFSPELPTKVSEVTRQLRKIWRGLGAWMLRRPLVATSGTDAHLAGPFPMGYQGTCGTSAFGELNVAPGVFVTGGAAFPSLPSKYLTLTIMANAERIGRHLVAART